MTTNREEVKAIAGKLAERAGTLVNWGIDEHTFAVPSPQGKVWGQMTVVCNGEEWDRHGSSARRCYVEAKLTLDVETAEAIIKLMAARNAGRTR